MSEKEKKKKGSKKTSKDRQDKVAPGGTQSTGSVNGTPTKSNSPVTKITTKPADNKEIHPLIEKQNISNEKHKGEKIVKLSKSKKKQKKAGFIHSLFTFRSFLIFYILGVSFTCHDRSREQCSYLLEVFCYNGISQYIITHDWFHKYIEPSVIDVKSYSNVYGKQAFDFVSIQYEAHAKPHVSPYLEAAQPHIQTARELSIEYMYTPAAEGLRKTQELYNKHAKEHVDKYYTQAKEFSTPYVISAQKRAANAYKQILDYNSKTVQPWYRKTFVPFVMQSKDKTVIFYNEHVDPYTKYLVKVASDNYHEHIVPSYYNYIHPHLITVLELITGPDDDKLTKEIQKKEAERKTKEEAERKARTEAAIHKAKMMAERIAQIDAKNKARTELKAKEEAKRKSEIEAERKVKEEVERKAKEEVERKAKEEAERKAKDEAKYKAKIDSERKERANSAVRNTASIVIPLTQDNIFASIKEYQLNAKSTAKEALDNVEAKIASLKKLGSEHLSNLKNIVDEVVSDTKKNITLKHKNVSDYAKKAMDSVKENARESTKSTEESLAALNEKFKKSKEDFEFGMDRQLLDTKTKVYNTAGKTAIDQTTIDDVEGRIKAIRKNITEVYKGASLIVNEGIVKIEEGIASLKATAREVALNIVNSSKMAIQSLNKFKTPSDPNVDNAKTSNEKDFSIPALSIQTSNDPVLDQLKVRFRSRQDPVLEKLKSGYNEAKIENKEVKSSEDDGDNDYELDN